VWLQGKKTIARGVLGGIIHFIYEVMPTLQPAEDFGRVYAAVSGTFIVSSIIGAGLWTKRSLIDMK
jgi:drug/metabolite transporter superfamily protein YnfA